MEYITLNKHIFNKLKNRYKQAIDKNEIQFEFRTNGITHTFLTAFAKYFIQYHEGKFK